MYISIPNDIKVFDDLLDTKHKIKKFLVKIISDDAVLM